MKEAEKTQLKSPREVARQNYLPHRPAQVTQGTSDVGVGGAAMADKALFCPNSVNAALDKVLTGMS